LSGTDRTKGEFQAIPGAPAVILVDPQLGENIGMVARAMLNTGLDQLRLVRPRDGWPNEKAVAAASGADLVLAGAKLFDSTAEALADLQLVYAASARPRGMVKRIVEPREAAARVRAAAGEGTKTGLLFGPERSGLTNDDMALADAVVSVPLNPGFASLNLAQAVLLLGYEWYRGEARPLAERLERNRGRAASKAELDNFMTRLEGALDRAGFLLPEEKRAGMVRNLRALFGRMDLTEPEVNTLHGIVSALGRRDRAPLAGEEGPAAPEPKEGLEPMEEEERG
jgi:tRNA/rRNA methyltransferase